MKKKGVLISNFPVSYRVDFFNELVKDEQIEYNFIFVSDRSNHKSKVSLFENESFLRFSTFINSSYKISVLLELLKFLISKKPDFIVIGGMPYYYLSPLFYRIIFRCKNYIWWGGTILSESSVSKAHEIVRVLLLKSFDGAIYYSKLSQDYLHNLKSNFKDEFILGNNTRDDKKFHKNLVASPISNDKTDLVLLTVGFQFDFKNTIFLLRALSSLEVTKGIKLIVVGEGPEKVRLMKYSEEHNLKVEFPGFIDPSDIYSYYRNADIFLHPSLKDRWPQTYTEAICSGLPPLISNKSGVHDNLIEEFYQDIVFDPTDLEDLKTKLSKMIEDDDFRNEIASKSKLVSEQNNGITKAKEITGFFINN
ncbi:glycosyltransferase involved in cell wall biosynthesis [Christiangramia gaetbulicola]|uniref:Glycosyltransferase involved in cell wall biosynthesis n=1 Tax=Christiangramia gaetbulicola TaxID=703340 RepID=A0A2T6AKY4_9FLAO|nr:glycosyltransferase [Christiangramia gaetbulicola]PTX44481.1 glycosyltransferase involved in cell wall biosynthesis [Christiangramia gaetbulicola]